MQNTQTPQPVSLKPGILTTEFLGTLVSVLVGVLVVFRLVPMEQAVVFQNDLLQFLQICVQIFTLAVSAYAIVKPLVTYIQGRVALKQTLLQSQTKG